MNKSWEESRKWESEKAAAKESKKRQKWLAEIPNSKKDIGYFYENVTEPICEYFQNKAGPRSCCELCCLYEKYDKKSICILSEEDEVMDSYMYGSGATIKDVKKIAKEAAEQINKRFGLYKWIKMK